MAHEHFGVGGRTGAGDDSGHARRRKKRVIR
jgi:hypothetical protein